MQRALGNRLEQLEKELLIEAAYFIPLARGVEITKKLVERGVRVRVVTNSLASNDVLPAFAGYSISRKDLIRAGVEIHEVRWERALCEKADSAGLQDGCAHEDDRVRSQGRVRRQL